MPKNHDRSEKVIRKDERKRIRKKKRAKGTLYTMFAALLAFLISLFTGFLGLNPVGFYGDGSGSHSLLNQSSESETAEVAEPVKMAEEDQVPSITVDGENYIYEGETYDLGGISEVIESFDDSLIILEDKNAINSVFESLEEVLNTRGLEYNIVENYE